MIPPRSCHVEGIAAGLQVLAIGKDDSDIVAESRFEEDAEVGEPSA
jgi:hypothetical protein